MANGSALDALTGTLPVIVMGGVALKMTESMFGRAQPQSVGTAWQGSIQWQPISKKEAYDLIGKKKVSMLQKSPGKIYTWGYDKFKYEGGKFWLA